MASYEKRENGTWSVRFRYMNNGNLANKRLSGYRTKKDAEKAYSEYILANDFSPSAIGDKTFGEMYNLYMDYKSERVKESTLYSCRKLYESNIMEIFGNKKLKEITPLTIKDFQSSLNKRELSYNYKKKALSIISSVFNFAYIYYDYDTDPTKKAEKFRNVNEEKEEKKVWDFADFTQFIEVVGEDEPYRTFFSFLFYTGCRKGEALAMYWSDVNFDKETISITKTYTRKTENAPYKIQNTPKTTSSNRTIKIPKVLVDLLKNLKSQRKGQFVFYGERPIPENTLRNRLKSYIKKANAKSEHKIPDLTFHEFRHSHASLLISKGISIVTVSKRLGHTNIEETLNTYSHLMPNDEDKAIDVFNNLGTSLGTRK